MKPRWQAPSGFVVRCMRKNLIDRVRSKEEVVFINELSWNPDESDVLDKEWLEMRREWFFRALAFLEVDSAAADGIDAGGNPLLSERELRGAEAEAMVHCGEATGSGESHTLGCEHLDARASSGKERWLQSPLVEIPTFQKMATRIWAGQIPGRWFAKMDAALPIAGSVKARGGIYEVVCFAMEVLEREGLVPSKILRGFEEVTSAVTPAEEKADVCSDSSQRAAAISRDIDRVRIREVLSKYTVTVASTGNLGLSIGLTARKLGFCAKVYLSSDAKAWKVEKLREVGAEVVLVESDYNAVVAMARAESVRDSQIYFVDDERSQRLFEGYALAALELREQLEAEVGHDVLMASPLFLYIPCGVGGAPAGISAGMKAVFGEQVHLFVAEPLEAPSVLLELARRASTEIGAVCGATTSRTVANDETTASRDTEVQGAFRAPHARHGETGTPCMDVRSVGLSGQTVADGLAVPVASGKAMDVLGATLAGAYTLADDKMLAYLKLLHEMENLRVEPSAAAALQGPGLMYYTKEGFDYVLGCGLMPHMDQSIHISWMTGGGLMPGEVFDEYYKNGEEKATALVDFLSAF